MKVADLIVSVVFFLLGCWVLWQATMLPQFTVFGPGPEFMPNVLGVLLLILSVLLFVNSWRNATPLPQGFWPDRSGALRIAAMVVALFLYTALLEVAGYLLLTFGYAAFMLLAMAKYRWYVDLALAAAITFGFYQSFVVVLGVPVPRGVFGI
ncbi:MAG: tripartite tricarboxylate transporter TctB family protein [Chloroflexota bacterium]